MRSWGEGRVTLLGDACHPTLPFMAQGAAMAIEDAAVLGRALAANPEDIASAFAAYAMERNENGQSKHPEHVFRLVENL
jgi:2-polyprenyl-6-methoxyphenol hydroxylase-like FAD-dependent oxidoreductase